MATITIGRLRARYHVPETAGSRSRARLDRVLTELTAAALEPAVERLALPAHEELCIRQLRVRTHVRLAAPDSALRSAWSLAITQALRQAVEGGGRDVVRYSSREHALVDAATGVALGDCARAWAWRQLGLWTDPAAGETAAAAELCRVLSAAPTRIVPVLRSLAAHGALARLLPRFDEEQWARLAQAALGAAAAPPALALPDAAARGDIDPPATNGRTPSPFAPFAADATHPAGTRRALAVLAVLDAEPIALRDPEAPARVAALLAAQSSTTPVPATEPARGGAAAADAAAFPTDQHTGDAAAGSRGHRRTRPLENRTGSTAESALAGSARSGSTRAPSAAAPGAGRDVADAPTRSADHAARAAAPERPLPDVRRTGETAWAGLLFLISVLEHGGTHERIAAMPALRERPFRWRLHQLALALAPVDATDPAALAFAGLPPGAQAPDAGQPPATRAELRALERLAWRVAGELRRRVAEPAESARAALRRVCARRALIVADPGWIEARLPLDTVTMDCRRAGLDLDPGYVPWLGVVVRFRYE